MRRLRRLWAAIRYRAYLIATPNYVPSKRKDPS